MMYGEILPFMVLLIVSFMVTYHCSLETVRCGVPFQTLLCWEGVSVINCSYLIIMKKCKRILKSNNSWLLHMCLVLPNTLSNEFSQCQYPPWSLALLFYMILSAMVDKEEKLFVWFYWDFSTIMFTSICEHWTFRCLFLVFWYMDIAQSW